MNYQQSTINYSASRFSEVQEPHPQPPKRKRGGGYNVPQVIRKRYINYQQSTINNQQSTMSEF